jgi:hypothetical protein
LSKVKARAGRAHSTHAIKINTIANSLFIDR